MFRAWQIVVAVAATFFMLHSINSGTPWIIAIPSALLIMSVLAADPSPSRVIASRVSWAAPRGLFFV